MQYIDNNFEHISDEICKKIPIEDEYIDYKDEQ